MQVAQLEKEKRGMNERLRVIAKRIDHLERGFRKEERPLLAQDYENQQKTDKETFESIQRARREAARQAHQDDLTTKARLARMMGDYLVRKEVLLRKKDDEYAKRIEAANKKVMEEKEKRRRMVMKEREEERIKKEEEERVKREEEAEEARKEAERLAEEENKRAEEEAKQREAEEEKRKAEAEAVARREERERERAEAAERARLQQQREEEAEARRQARRAEATAASRKPPVPVAKEETGVWRRGTAPVNPPPRSESPAPSATTGKYRPGAFGGAGWRTREDPKTAGGGSGGSNGPAARVIAGESTPRSGSPAPPPLSREKEEEIKREDDGFQTVSSRGVWKPKRGRA